eukprot:TRINITY_DN5789_c0_g1_i1.p1 TRINITY_DN5789_c0_g1~~TRINITY_DN5789_c0_g1_i1.p1  ORF type:complete len:354 (-),score=90.60 TRINITY_DN5789_c0_g1_i1:175-1236(-)
MKGGFRVQGQDGVRGFNGGHCLALQDGVVSAFPSTSFSMSFKSNANAILQSKTVSAIKAPDSILALDSKATLHESFQKLVDKNILSAPVYDQSTSTWIGFLDVRDLVSFIVFVYDEQKVTDNTRLQDLLVHGLGQYKMATTDGVTVGYLARRNRFVPVSEEDSLTKVVEVLSKGVHRVPVVKDNKVVNIVSQSSIIKLLADELMKNVTSSDSDPTIADLSIGTAPVLSVGKGVSVIDTFRTMDKKQRSGIALVAPTGRLVGTTTGKDLGPFLQTPTLGALNLGVFEHLQAIRNKQDDIKTPAIAVFNKDKVSRAVSLLAATRVHRVFVVDGEEHYRPLRCISITDILNYLVSA